MATSKDGAAGIFDRIDGWGPDSPTQDSIDDNEYTTYEAYLEDGIEPDSFRVEDLEDRYNRQYTTKSNRPTAGYDLNVRNGDGIAPDDFNGNENQTPDWNDNTGDYRPDETADPDAHSAIAFRDRLDGGEGSSLPASRDMDSSSFFGESAGGMQALIRTSLLDRVANWGHTDAVTNIQYMNRSDDVEDIDYDPYEFGPEHAHTWEQFRNGSVND